MISTIQILVLLLAVVAAVAVLAARLKIPPAILLVLTGVFLALVPGLPALALAPELVLLLVLPPVIYASAVAMSWREFRFNLRPISLLAVGCVVFTTIAVAAAAHFVLGLAWPVGFVLGAIVLHQLERPPADQRRDAPPGHLLLGFLHLSHRRHGFPHHRPSGAHADRPYRRSFITRAGHRRRRRQFRGDRDAIHLDVSGNLFATLALSPN